MLLCKGCGYANLDGSIFCSVCGKPLEATGAAVLDLSGIVRCPSCAAPNEEHVSFCRSCGEKLKKVAVPVLAAVAAGSSLEDALSGDRMTIVDDVSSGEAGDPGFVVGTSETSAERVSTRHESFVAKLDKLEEEMEARHETQMPESALPPDLDDKQAKLDSLSSTLDALIADLLEVEIHEYAFPDFIHPDESGFPSKDPTSYEVEVSVAPPKKRSLHEILLVSALITAIFLVGLCFGVLLFVHLGI